MVNRIDAELCLAGSSSPGFGLLSSLPRSRACTWTIMLLRCIMHHARGSCWAGRGVWCEHPRSRLQYTTGIARVLVYIVIWSRWTRGEREKKYAVKTALSQSSRLTRTDLAQSAITRVLFRPRSISIFVRFSCCGPRPPCTPPPCPQHRLLSPRLPI